MLGRERCQKGGGIVEGDPRDCRPATAQCSIPLLPSEARICRNVALTSTLLLVDLARFTSHRFSPLEQLHRVSLASLRCVWSLSKPVALPASPAPVSSSSPSSNYLITLDRAFNHLREVEKLTNCSVYFSSPLLRDHKPFCRLLAASQRHLPAHSPHNTSQDELPSRVRKSVALPSS